MNEKWSDGNLVIYLTAINVGNEIKGTQMRENDVVSCIHTQTASPVGTPMR